MVRFPHSRSVGVFTKKFKMKEKIDLTGQKFNRLTVIGRSDKKGKWCCRCDCGCPKDVTVSTSDLKNGRTKSCGCFKKERARETNTTHGLRYHPLYNFWKNMKNRCYNIKHKSCSHYSEKGIYVCDRWLNSVKYFVEDMYPTYKEGLELDRINNDEGYSPENCRWVTPQQNLMNTSSRKGSSSRYKGVFKMKGKERWRVSITKDYEHFHIGYFDNEIDAAKAYNEAAKDLFGEYANLNIIDEELL